MVDEAYGEFGGESATAILGRHDRLAIVRSFSKSWRLAGARLGYLLAHPWLVEAIQVARLPYHLSALSQACGEVAVRHAGAALSAVEEIVAERDRLGKELQRVRGVEVFPSAANFVLVRTPLEGPALWQGLVDRGVLVRDFSSMYGLARCLRVTVGTGEQNATFVEALRGVLADAADGRLAVRARFAGRRRRWTSRSGLVVDGRGVSSADTGIPFFDHMLEQLGKHAGFDLSVKALGDLKVDAHHTVEDTGLAIGDALRKSLGTKGGIERFGDALVPLDEALLQVAVDLSRGRTSSTRSTRRRS